MKRIRLLIADDHPVVRAGIQGMLVSQPDFEVVGEATSGEEAVALVVQVRPDIVLMDLRMAGLDGVTATARIKQQRPETSILVLTTYESNRDILQAIEAGATGYLLKDTPREQLVQAIRNVAEGKSALAPAVAARLFEHMHTPAEDVPSSRELEILALVAEGASNKEAARQLHISEATVKTHLIHLFRKLGVADRTAAVTKAQERGLLRLKGQA